MPLLTTGTIVTVAGILWKYWRVPHRLWQWRKANEVEPAIGQLWRKAGLGPKHSDWKVTEVEDEGISLKSTTDKDDFGDLQEQTMSWEDWEVFVKKSRLYCKDSNESLEDAYFGEHSED